ncbi:hypothetical protein QT955_015460, partial [Xanthomonas campestris pv. campestris]
MISLARRWPGRIRAGLCLVALVAGLAGCATPPPPASATTIAPADQFLAALAAYCGQAFAGRVLIDTPASKA